MRRILGPVMLLAVFGLLGMAGSATATVVYGSITKDTTWTIDGSPYILPDGLYILSGATLTIKPGVTVKCGNMIMVYGHLIAKGTSAAPIRFTSSSGGLSPGEWKGIEIMKGSSGATLDWCVIRCAGGGTGFGALSVFEMTVSGGVKISNTTITRSASNGIYLDRNSALYPPVIIENCKIRECLKCPVQMSSFGDAGPRFSGNNIFKDNGKNWIGAAGPPPGKTANWGDAPLPYAWEGSEVRIPTGSSLNIHGSKVAAAAQNTMLYVQGGRLSAWGAVFTSLKQFQGSELPQPGDGVEIYLSEVGSKCHLTGCSLLYGMQAVRCYATPALLFLDNCAISKTADDAVYIERGVKKAYIRNCLFEDIGNRGLVKWGEGTPIVTGSKFTNINHEAVYVGSGTVNLGNLNTLGKADDGGNSFADPGKINVENMSGNPVVRAHNNWWGYTSAKDIAAHSVWGKVDFSSFLKQDPFD